MRRRELEAALRAASRISRDLEFIIIGSQAVHAHCRRPPAEVIISQECDVYPRTYPGTANLLASHLGRASAFARRNGFYVDVVAPEIATLPDGWEKRLKPLRVGRVTAWCLDLHDLLLSKLAAGRLKDLELVGALLKLRLGNVSTLRRRIRRLPALRDQQAARSVLNVVLDDLRRTKNQSQPKA